MGVPLLKCREWACRCGLTSAPSRLCSRAQPGHEWHRPPDASASPIWRIVPLQACSTCRAQCLPFPPLSPTETGF